MTRKLYAWEKDGKFYLSAFVRPVDGRRPSVEFADKGALETEAMRRGIELDWQPDGDK